MPWWRFPMRMIPPCALAALTACAVHAPHAARRAAQSAEAPHDDSELALRYAWPGQRVDAAWIAAARHQDRALAASLPRAAARARPADAAAGLDPQSFTPLGPRPLGDPLAAPQYLVGGRVNTLAVDPRDPAVVYLGGDGSGVWKTVNCCSAATVWQPVSDQPEVAASAIGDLAIDPHDHATIYAATGDLRFSNWSFGSAGLLRSSDAGASWQVLGAEVFGPMYPPSAGGFPQYQALSKVVVDPADRRHLAVGSKTGLFFSADAGATWTGPCYTNAYATGPAAQRQDITALVVAGGAAGAPSRLLAAVGTRGTPTPNQPDLGATGANGVYAADWPSLGCPAWTLRAAGWPAGTGNGLPGGRVGRIELALAPSRPQRVYALVADTVLTNPPLGVFRSEDFGASWTQACAGAACAPAGCDGFGQQLWYDLGLSVDPLDADVLFASAQDLMRSTDAGASFRNLTCGYADFDAIVHVDHHARAFVAGDPNRLLLGTDGGVYYSANARADTPAFAPVNTTLNTLELYSGDIGPDFATSAAPQISAGAQDNGSTGKIFAGTPTAPQDWDRYAPGGDGTYTQIEPILGKRWYFSIAYGGIHVTYGSGGLGGGVAPIAPNWGGGSPNVERKSLLMPFQLYKFGALDQPGSGCTSSAGCTHLIAGTYRLWETVVGGLPGSEWFARTGDLTKNTLILGGENRSYINALSYAPGDPHVAVVGTNDGNVQYVFGLGVQYNGNCPDTPQACALAVDVSGGNAQLPLRPVLDVAVDPRDALTAYAALGGFAANSPGQGGHVWRVRCSAQCASFAWDDVSGDLPDIPVNALQPNPNDPRQLFAGTDWGLYFTDDVTATPPHWQRFAGAPRVMVWDMAVDRGATALALFTRSRGAWVWPLPAVPEAIFADGFEGRP